jgi:hypothetical protein
MMQIIPQPYENNITHHQMEYLASLGLRLLDNSASGVDFSRLSPDMLFQRMLSHFYSRREWHPVFTSFLDTPEPDCDGREHIASFLNFLAHFKWTLFPNDADLEFKSRTLRRILDWVPGDHESISSVIVERFLDGLNRINDRTYLPGASRSAIIRDIVSMLEYHPPLAGSWEIANYAKNTQLLDLWTEALVSGGYVTDDTRYAFDTLYEDRQYYSMLSTFRLIDAELSLEPSQSRDKCEVLFFANSSSERQLSRRQERSSQHQESESIIDVSDGGNRPSQLYDVGTSVLNCRIYPILKGNQVIKSLVVEETKILVKGLDDENMRIELCIELLDQEIRQDACTAVQGDREDVSDFAEGVSKQFDKASAGTIQKGARLILDLISSIV